MRTAKQFSVSLANKPGRLADVLAALGRGKVGVQALVVMDCGERGTARFVPDNPTDAAAVLESLSVGFDVADVLLVDVPSHPGGFRKICERLAAEHLNIDYAYRSDITGKAKGGAPAVIRVNDLAKAQRVLSEGGTPRKRLPFRRLAMSR